MSRIAKIERKVEYLPCIGGEMKATNDVQGIIEGYLNYFSNIDFGDDRTMPGAFKRTISEAYARKSQQNLSFLYPYLWNHDYSIPPAGGIFDASETTKGLYVKVQMNMETDMGRNLYASFRSGFLKKQSMGYRAIQVDWVKEDGRSIRNLLEVAVMEGSAVVFPMNDLAQVDTVKNRSYFFMDRKGSASGKTSWPLADRATNWDKGQAMKDIQAYARNGDTMDWSKFADCFFWVAKSPPENIGDGKFPFVAKVGGTMKAVPAAIFNGAARLSNANIDDVDGVKAKMAVYYRKMKAPIPWEKGNTMDIWSKDYTESYQQTNQQDWISDLWNLWYPLRNEIIQAFVTGDTPAEDVQKALDQFSAAVMAYVQQGIALDMTEYLQPDDDDSSPMPMYMMSADDNPETKEAKEGRVLSAANHAKLTKAADGIMAHVMQMKSLLQSASQRSSDLQGYPLTMGADKPPQQKQEDDPEQPAQTDERLVLDDLFAKLKLQNAFRGI